MTRGNRITRHAYFGREPRPVGLDWQLGGFAADPPTLSGAFADTSTDQLVHAMAGFGGGGTSDGLNALALGIDTAHQQLLTMPP